MIEELIEAYYETRKNKRRSADSVEFELHYERNIMRLKRDLENLTYTPKAYTFIVTRPRPREVFACEMSLRIIHHYLDMRMRPLIEKRLTNRTFNNRIGYGGCEAVNTVISNIYEASAGFTKDCWIIKMDIKGYFPNANQDIAYNQIRAILDEDYHGSDKDIVQYMLLCSAYSYPTHHCRRKSPLSKWGKIPADKSMFSKRDGIGAAIGYLFWQNAMNLYLNDIDHWLLDFCMLLYVRFVDDMLIVTDNLVGVLQLIPELRERLKALGCELHPRKFYCQHYTKGVEFIGSTIKMDRVYTNNRTVRNAFLTLKKHNKRIKPSRIQSFISSMNSFTGIFKNRNSYGILRNFIDEVDPKWWEYCKWNEQKKCIQARDEYSPREMLTRKYNVKFLKHGKDKRINQRSGIGDAPTQVHHVVI